MFVTSHGMKNTATVFGAALLATSMLAATAMAASKTDTGVIKKIEPARHAVELTDGRMFEFHSSWKGTGFKDREKVTVTYDMKDGKMVGKAIAHEGRTLRMSASHPLINQDLVVSGPDKCMPRHYWMMPTAQGGDDVIPMECKG